MSEPDNKTVPATSQKAEVVPLGWAAFETLRHEIDRLFEDFRPFGGRWPTERPPSEGTLPGARAGWNLAPAMDMVEKEKEYEITAELPGMGEDQVDVKVSDRILTIRGEKTEKKEEKQKDYFLSERRFGSFQRSFRLPDGVDTDAVDAHFEKGVLTVRLPKSAEARQSEKKIAVKTK